MIGRALLGVSTCNEQRACDRVLQCIIDYRHYHHFFPREPFVIINVYFSHKYGALHGTDFVCELRDIDINVYFMMNKTCGYTHRQERRDLDTSSEASSRCERVTRCARERMLKDNRPLLSLNEIGQSLSIYMNNSLERNRGLTRDDFRITVRSERRRLRILIAFSKGRCG